MFYYFKFNNSKLIENYKLSCQSGIPLQAEKIKNCRGGFIFIEILLAIVLIDITLVGLLGIGGQSFSSFSAIKKSAQINALLREEIEAVRSFRNGSSWSDNGLGTVNTGSANPYYVSLDNSVSPPKWKLNAGVEIASGFSRSIIFDKVSRDASQNIEAVYNAANDDPNTKKITAIVDYGGKTYQAITYFTNWK